MRDTDSREGAKPRSLDERRTILATPLFQRPAQITGFILRKQTFDWAKSCGHLRVKEEANPGRFHSRRHLNDSINDLAAHQGVSRSGTKTQRAVLSPIPSAVITGKTRRRSMVVSALARVTPIEENLKSGPMPRVNAPVFSSVSALGSRSNRRQ